MAHMGRATRKEELWKGGQGGGAWTERAAAAVPWVVMPGLHSSPQLCFRKASGSETSRVPPQTPHLLPALASGVGGPSGGCTSLGSDPPSLLLWGGGARLPALGWRQAAGPELLQRERESRMSEGVGTGWQGRAGWRRGRPAPRRGRLSGEQSEPSPHHPCAPMSGPRCCSPPVC